ncbi:MAG: hypothetical protein ISP90_19035 [Nevskia sp.]|nr:hypothetical protein [Nevskia sp.]
MILDSRPRSWLLTLLCVAFLLGRVDGAHLHLCFDGAEPPASLRFVDSEPRQSDPGMSAVFVDVDIALAGEALAKQSISSFDLPLVLTAIALMGLAWATSPQSTTALKRIPLPGAWPRVRPPLRAPPR